VAASQAQQPVSGPETAVGNLQIDSPQKSGQQHTGELLGFLDSSKRRRSQGRKRVDPAPSPSIKVSTRSTPVYAPLIATVRLNPNESRTVKINAGQPVNLIQILAGRDKISDGCENLVLMHRRIMRPDRPSVTCLGRQRR
jgi:hypothetical protein